MDYYAYAEIQITILYSYTIYKRTHTGGEEIGVMQYKTFN